MEVEIKLRLASAATHAKLADALRQHGNYRATLEQENFFFDGPNRELVACRHALRVRFYDGNRKAVITVKVGAGWLAAVGLVGFWAAHVPSVQ